MNPSIRRTLTAAAALTVAVGLAACSGGSDGKSDATPTAAQTTAAANLSVAKYNLVGPGCAAYATQVPTGKGSIEGMTNDPLVTAASNNPMLKTLTEAVSGKLNPKVNLVGTLNGKDYTVFAPVDTAFAQLPAKRLNKLKKDPQALVKLLTYHVVAGRLAPGKVLGNQLTVEGKSLRITGSGSSIKVNNANMICGGIRTANATVYLIDKVLDPS